MYGEPARVVIAYQCLRRSAWRRCSRCRARAACAWAPSSSASSSRGALFTCPTPPGAHWPDCRLNSKESNSCRVNGAAEEKEECPANHPFSCAQLPMRRSACVRLVAGCVPCLHAVVAQRESTVSFVSVDALPGAAEPRRMCPQAVCTHEPGIELLTPLVWASI